MLYSFLCATLWASTGIFVKFIDGMSVFHIIWGRFLVAFIFGVIVLKSRSFRRLDPSTYQTQEFPLALMMTLYYVLATFSFYYAPVAVAALLIALAPLFTFLLRFILQKEFNQNELVGFLVAFAGLVFYFYGKDYAAEGYSVADILFGSAFGLGAALLRAVFSFTLWRRVNQGVVVNATSINNLTLILGVTLLLPFLFLQPGEVKVTQHNLIFITGLGLIATFLPNLLNNLSSMRLNPTLHNIIGMTTPISASLMAWAFLDEYQDLHALIAIIITVSGIFLSMRPTKKPVQVGGAET
ncbi:DMT family transporter [Hahella aquimaris]|uniref:DMT family transporter n=1 Tax=Hahella sp. HNIBRBA332 TaxID=3015983 RepID=UPI00273CF392|nr:DMT family transporter [Hahella sp. HNIBRBA332]WLQ11982.1 DMT family transporter [Hahella sp. HNIBRBA332]